MKYLFVVCPNQSGSTLIYRHLKRCEAVSFLDTEGQLCWGDAGLINRRGTVKEFFFSEYAEKFSSEDSYDWNRIKKAWDSVWQRKRCSKTEIFLEKSPPNVFRVELLKKYFKPAHFIFSIRCPYAMCEGMMRHESYPLNLGAKHWGECARQQIENIKNNPDSIFFKYEELCQNKSLVAKEIVRKFPELGDLNLNEEVAVHSIDDMTGQRKQSIVNFNQKQYNNLSKEDFKEINGTLLKYRKEMRYFGYKFLEKEDVV